ncbi:MAG TPA: protoporphyrinogen oxidase [Phototrophicaceae bacterium]|nr:protoporphyrinogen oxidase [Phototrophicaceae bacterium]
MTSRVMSHSAPLTPAQTKQIVIIGGGISGLSAAWYVQQAHNQSMALKVTVLESSNRWGGKILTEQIEGVGDAPFVIEAGPDSFLTQKPWALQLARELGLGERLLGTNDRLRNVYVLQRGRPVVLPDGVLLIVPTKFRPFALSPLISPLGKLRMGLDLLIPAKRDDADETLAEFVRRRLGNEALDKIAEPLMSGIYNAEADKQSILATFARFRQLEREHGSLIRGMLASRRQRPPVSAAAPAAKTSAFMSLQNGTQELIGALVNHLNADLRLNTAVTAIEQIGAGNYQVITNNGGRFHADAVVLTTPAYTAADLLRPLAPQAAEQLAAIRYVSTGTISLAFRAADIQRPLHGFGLVIPKSERRPINAVTISSTKFDHRAPEGYVLLRVFFGGSRSPESMAYDDDQLLRGVRAELRQILGIEAAPLFHRIYRWHNANPQYDVNHLERVAAIEAALPAGIYVTGSALRGVGMPDCVYQAQQTVSKIMDTITVPEAEAVP